MFKKFKKFYSKWIKIGRKIAAFQIKVMFTIAYYTFMVPFGYIVKLFVVYNKPGWHEIKNTDDDLENAGRQF